MKAMRVMTVDVVCVHPETPVRHASAIMTEMRIRHLPVVANRLLVGILSDRDILLHTVLKPDGQRWLPEMPVGRAMAIVPITCRASSTISEVAGLMVNHRIDAVPVVDTSNSLLGLLTSTDLLELLRETEQVSDVIPFSFSLRKAEDLLAKAV